jgi:hypothetical protein
MSSQFTTDQSRRETLGALRLAGSERRASAGKSRSWCLAELSGRQAGTPSFAQISDTHIGFKVDANPDVAGTVKQTIDLVNAMKENPAFIMHTGDITHLSKAAEFPRAAQGPQRYTCQNAWRHQRQDSAAAGRAVLD